MSDAVASNLYRVIKSYESRGKIYDIGRIARRWIERAVAAERERNELRRRVEQLVFENAGLQEDLDSSQRLLKLANQALERAGSAARFGTKKVIPGGTPEGYRKERCPRLL